MRHFFRHPREPPFRFSWTRRLGKPPSWIFERTQVIFRSFLSRNASEPLADCMGFGRSGAQPTLELTVLMYRFQIDWDSIAYVMFYSSFWHFGRLDWIFSHRREKSRLTDRLRPCMHSSGQIILIYCQTPLIRFAERLLCNLLAWARGTKPTIS